MNNENYKGIVIRIIEKIIGNVRVVSAGALINNKRYEVVGTNKYEVLPKIKRIIDRGGK